ncbi:MAG: hypothetical protein KDK55_02465 [Chlamydiia bacterium]|nr:hypothetical protein [Chlamydiia bacterium]
MMHFSKNLYQNKLKNQEFCKASARNLSQRNGTDETQLQQVKKFRQDKILECPAQPKIDSSSYFGIDRMIEKQRVPHALLFTGSFEANNAALDFAKRLLHIKTETHPDLHLYRPDEKSGLHSISNIRALIEEVALFPYSAAWKVFLIFDADKMLPTGSHALLKTLEEPTPHTVIILTAMAKDQLLPTIRSRTQEIFVPSLSIQEETEVQKQLLALLLLKNRKDYLVLKQELEKFKDYQAEGALLDTILEWARDLTALSAGSDKLLHPQFKSQMELYLKNHPIPDLFDMQQRVKEAKLSYERGVKFSICLEELFLHE